MRIPRRKPGRYAMMPKDTLLTGEKFDELSRKLGRLKLRRPAAMSEVARLAEMGDFSENAAYQMAKGRLRGLNNAIAELEEQLNRADIIPKNAQKACVQIGHTVTLEVNGQKKIYTILGSAESDPARGIVSHTSPLGAALIGKRTGEVAEVASLANKKAAIYTIVDIR